MKKLISLFIAARLYLLATPLACFYLGAGLNQAVLVANDGKFPVMLNEHAAHSDMFRVGKNGFIDIVHYRMTRETKLNFLADWINLGTSILSPGDLLLALADMLRSPINVIWATLLINDVRRLKSA